jgi:AraC-like DNA-binding protein
MPTIRDGTPSNDSSPSPRPAGGRIVTACHDEYFRAFRALRLEGFLLDRASRPWRVSRRRLASGLLEHGLDAAPWSATGVCGEGVAALAFSGSPEAQLRVDGRDISRDAVCLWPAGARVGLVARRAADWFVLTAPASDFVASRSARVPAAAGPAAHFYRARPDELSRLRSLGHRLAGSGEAWAAAIVPADAAALEAELVELLGKLVANGPARDDRSGSSRIGRSAVLARLEELLAQRSSGPVYVAELCEATGLPERTLRYVLAEQFGTSPIRLLRNHRLCRLRRALRAETEPAESLARLAERHGFWHMGTLAADYRRLFGELPSETRRSAGERVPAKSEALGDPRGSLARPPGAVHGPSASVAGK